MIWSNNDFESFRLPLNQVFCYEQRILYCLYGMLRFQNTTESSFLEPPLQGKKKIGLKIGKIFLLLPF